MITNIFNYTEWKLNVPDVLTERLKYSEMANSAYVYLSEENNKIPFRSDVALHSGLLDTDCMGAGFSCQTLNLPQDKLHKTQTHKQTYTPLTQQTQI